MNKAESNTLAVCLQKGDSTAGGDFATWLWQIARNSLIDFFRQKKPLHLADMEHEGENIPDSMDYISSNAELREVLDIVKKLPAEDQELFQMYFLSDLSYSDLAKVTEKTESNLRVAIHRIRQKIIKQHKND